MANKDFMDELSEILGDEKEANLDTSLEEFPYQIEKADEIGAQTEQTTLGGKFDMTQGIKTDVDLVLCIDVTRSMQPIIDTVKGMALSLYDDMIAALRAKKRKVHGFRVKVIAFRDYYCDGEYAMEESRFFNLPDETSSFSEFVLGLRADGGGDEPENALEAIALAMKSDWVHAVSEDERARNIIVVFTDASAHPFEKAKDGVTQFYPENMLTSLGDLKMAWEGQNSMSGTSIIDLYSMDPQAKRLIIYSPQDSYPWNEFAQLRSVKTSPIEHDRGGRELDRQILLDDISGSIR